MVDVQVVCGSPEHAPARVVPLGLLVLPSELAPWAAVRAGQLYLDYLQDHQGGAPPDEWRPAAEPSEREAELRAMYERQWRMTYRSRTERRKRRSASDWYERVNGDLVAALDPETNTRLWRVQCRVCSVGGRPRIVHWPDHLMLFRAQRAVEQHADVDISA